MFERFLARLSQSEYRDKFIIKGGMLIASIVGLDTRSTMDLDTTLKGLPLTEEKVLEAVDVINKIEFHDGVSFVIKSIGPIRKDDRYGGYCVRIDAVYDTIVTPLSIDVFIYNLQTLPVYHQNLQQCNSFHRQMHRKENSFLFCTDLLFSV